MMISASGPRFLSKLHLDLSHKKAQEPQVENQCSRNNLASSILEQTTGNLSILCAFCAFLWPLMKGLEPGVARGAAQIFFDAQQLVVFRDAIRARKRARFDLARVRRNGETLDEGMLGFARLTRDDS